MERKKLSRIMLFAVLLLFFAAFRAFPESGYVIAFILLVSLICISFFISFENKVQSSAKIIIIAVMSALTAVSRFIFAAAPGFKPVTALIIITAVYFGSQPGFMTGALSALISNIYFGQGAWTPFQMLAWGLIGFFAGLLGGLLKKSRTALAAYGALSGIFFSLFMDIYTTLWIERSFSVPRYLTLVAAALPFTAIYAVSNVIFLFILAKPIGKKMKRVKNKYFQNEESVC